MSLFKRTNQVIENLIEGAVFTSRWFQAPIYVGLIIGSGLYTYKFMGELWLMASTINDISEVQAMLMILGLIDISMVMNLLIIVIIGGYSIFTSKLDFDGKEDRPQWLDHLDADRLKVKLSTSLASISGVHLLKTFIDVHSEAKTGGFEPMVFEIGIHVVFIISALALALIVKILSNRSEAMVTRRL